MPRLREVSELVKRFEQNRESYRSSEYNETETRREFIDPFFKALGWDIDNEQGYAETEKTEHEKLLIQRQIDAADKQIDQLVYELYGLSDKEIRIVEKGRLTELVAFTNASNQPFKEPGEPRHYRWIAREALRRTSLIFMRISARVARLPQLLAQCDPAEREAASGMRYPGNDHGKSS